MMSDGKFHRPLTTDELVLSKALALWLAREMIGRLSHNGPDPELLHDEGQSNFEAGCLALSLVGVLRSEGQCQWRVFWKPGDAIDLPDGFNRRDLDFLLDALACHSDYVTELYQHHEVVLPTDSRLRQLCEALTSCGYMREVESGHGWTWTRKFGPWLVARQCWTLSDIEPACDTRVSAVLEKLPGRAIEKLSNSRCKWEPAFVMCFLGHWSDGQWTDWQPPPGTAPYDGWDLELIAGLYPLFQRASGKRRS